MHGSVLKADTAAHDLARKEDLRCQLFFFFFFFVFCVGRTGGRTDAEIKIHEVRRFLMSQPLSLTMCNSAIKDSSSPTVFGFSGFSKYFSSNSLGLEFLHLLAQQRYLQNLPFLRLYYEYLLVAKWRWQDRTKRIAPLSLPAFHFFPPTIPCPGIFLAICGLGAGQGETINVLFTLSADATLNTRKEWNISRSKTLPMNN